MKIEVEMKGERKILEMEKGATGEDLLEKLNLSPDSVLIIVDGKPMPYKDGIDGKSIKIIRVASGG